MGGRADTHDSARGAPVALPLDMDALPPTELRAGLVPVETAASGQSTAFSLQNKGRVNLLAIDVRLQY